MKSTPVIGSGMAYINGYGSPENDVDSTLHVADFAKVLAEKDADGDKLLSLAEMPDELAKSFFSAVDLDNSGSLSVNEWEYFQASIATKNSMMAIRLGGSGDMSSQNIVWKYFRNIPQLPSPVCQDDVVWMISDQGIVTSLNSATGEMIKRGRLPGTLGSVYASPVLADGKLFFTTVDGQVVATKADGEFEVLAVNNLGERCYQFDLNLMKRGNYPKNTVPARDESDFRKIDNHDSQLCRLLHASRDPDRFARHAVVHVSVDV